MTSDRRPRFHFVRKVQRGISDRETKEIRALVARFVTRAYLGEHLRPEEGISLTMGESAAARAVSGALPANADGPQDGALQP